VLPSACDNVATLQLRIMTTNAPGTDDETGVDDISITGSDIPPPTGACCVRYSTPGACVITTQVACLAIPGIYLGDGVPCDAGICATPTTRTTWGKVKTIYR
jgi:hypothetical protein